jgi:hypothetical protein
LSDRELTFKHGYALRQTARRQTPGTALTTPPPEAAAPPAPPKVLRADSGVRGHRRAITALELIDVGKATGAYALNPTAHGASRASADRLTDGGLRSGRPGQPIVASFANTRGPLPLRALGGLY